MKLEPLIIAILLFAGVMLGTASFYGDVQTTYNPSNSTGSASFQVYNESFTRMNKTMGNLMEHSTGFARKGFGDLSKYSDVALVFVDVAAVLLQVPGHINAYMSNIYNMTPFGVIPAWFMIMVGVVVVVAFALRVASIVMRSEEI